MVKQHVAAVLRVRPPLGGIDALDEGDGGAPPLAL
jgi:hypothetical protein